MTGSRDPRSLSATLEDYLEAIYHLESEKRAARVRDISKQLGVAKSTVNAALRSLSAKGLVDYSPYELIGLTDQGRERASVIAQNHRILHRFLTEVLALGTEKAEQIACEMEHAVDPETIDRFCCFLAFINQVPDRRKSWIEEFQRFMTKGFGGKSCRECVNEYMVGTDLDSDGDEQR